MKNKIYKYWHEVCKKAKNVDSHYNYGKAYLWHRCESDKYKKIINMNRNPILIGGCGRSGTTLLLSLVSSHPNIFAIPDETFAFCRSHYFYDKDSFLRIHKIYDILIENFRKLSGCTRWVEKSPKNVQSFELMEDFFGDEFRFLNIIRDGRDVVTSSHPEGNGDSYWVSCERWIKDVQKGLEISEKNNVITVKYEDLIYDYKTTMEKVFDQLQMSIPYDELDKFPSSSTIGNVSALKKGVTKVRENRGSTNRRSSEKAKKLLRMPHARSLLEYYDYI